MKTIASAACVLFLLGAAPRRRRSTISRRTATAARPTTFSPTEWATTSSATVRSSSQQADRQAAGAGLEPQPRQQLGRAGAADRLQRRDVRHQRAPPSRSTSPPASRSGSRRSIGRRRPRAWSAGVSNAAIYDGKIFRTTLDAHLSLRRQGRQGAVEVEGRGVEGWRFVDARAADRERRGRDRQFRRRVRRARLHRRLRHRDRQAALAQVPSGPRREGQRDLAAEQQCLGVGRRLGLDHRLLRPRPDVWGTGNPAPWATQTRPGDNLTSSVLAMRPKTGEIVWHYQFTPNDATTTTRAGS